MHLSAASRKRPVTACTECRRRKQKCDRLRPCNMCTGRDVTEKCTYDHLESSDEGSTVRAELPSPQSSLSTADNGQTSTPFMERPFQNQIGYARPGGENTLSELYELMGDDKELQALNSTNIMPLHPPTLRLFSDLCAKLPQQAVTRELIETFFSEANWYFAVLEKQYFEKLYTSWYALSNHLMANGQLGGLPPDLLHFPALIFQILAVALQFAPLDMPCLQSLGVDSFAARDRLSGNFSERGVAARRIMETDEPTLTTVQSNLMRALWLKNSSRGREAWHVLGAAIRMAQDLGLHKQSKIFQKPQSPLEDTLSQLWYDEYKRRLWIKLYCWDSHMAFALGWPRTINSSDCTIMPPLDRDIPTDPSTTVPMALFPHEPPSSFTPHLFQYAVCQQIHEAMSLGVHKRHPENYTLVETLHHRILSLLSGLPPVHRPVNPDRSWDLTHVHIPKQRQQIATAAHSFLMALHRPHAKIRVASRNAAIEAALSTLDAQECLFDLMATRYYSIYALSVYTVDAAIFLSVTILEYPPSDPGLSHRIQRTIEKAIHRLELAQDRVSLAKSGLLILKLCHLRMQPMTQFQQNMPRTTVQQPSQILDSISSGETLIDNASSHYLFPAPGIMPEFATSGVDNAAMFDDITVSNFDIESWVQQMNEMNGLV
ncbi:uncharacterized protein N7446_012881 [Penicillium canescens]|uniref:Zn(2)-C6 fungal-type domain-containing protein n=1 Tax=Penicillium canescens TaxID=5083 RepID=A0AAD6HYU6_PENCN|nr:uncharacterized protein N7446_012881 [Penicillium canescens]KAJ6022531.1 hypothetical protein N7460_012926 [Penicillium canescens]KAJ6026209.1 hypothetical protein N7444_013888 [Penicillium canescens]KAJ6041815.1 hypothetical protein N7446_012881 [Penicillium canescens]